MKGPLAGLPPIGFGCSPYRHRAGADLGRAIAHALEAGFRLLDTAEVYGTERVVGEALRRPGAPPRSELALVGKVWSTNHAPPDVGAACERSLRALGTDHFDLYLVHAPQALAHQGPLSAIGALSRDEAVALAYPRDEDGRLRLAAVPLAETWRAMESLVERGLARAIGVSNFDAGHLAELLAEARVPPAVNQVELHPYRRQADVVACCRRLGIGVMAHSPLSAPGLLGDEAIGRVARRHGRAPAQVVLRWHVQSDVVPLPSSTDPAHILANLQVFDFRLTAEDLDDLDSLDSTRA